MSWLVLGGLSSQGLELIYKLINLPRTSHLFLAATGLFHPIYNIISLTVILSMFSPIQHALLNVAKRVTVVLGFLIFTYSTSTGVSMTNVISGCLCISVIMWGNRVKVRISVFYIFYLVQEETQDTLRMPPSRWLIRGGILFLLIFPLLIISLSFSPFNLALTISLPFSSYLPGLALVPTASLPFTALWTHHQPLSPAASLRLSSLSSSGLPATLLCTSTPCLSSASMEGLTDSSMSPSSTSPTRAGPSIQAREPKQDPAPGTGSSLLEQVILSFCWRILTEFCILANFIECIGFCSNLIIC